jgi:hypothetical protein
MGPLKRYVAERERELQVHTSEEMAMPIRHAESEVPIAEEEDIFASEQGTIRHAESAEEGSRTKSGPKEKPSGESAPKYDLEALVTKGLTTLTDAELQWMFNSTKRKGLVKEFTGNSEEFKAAENRYWANKEKKKGGEGPSAFDGIESPMS